VDAGLTSTRRQRRCLFPAVREVLLDATQITKPYDKRRCDCDWRLVPPDSESERYSMGFAEFLARGRGCRFPSRTYRPRTSPRRRPRPWLERLEARELLASASQLFVAQAYRDLLHREAEPAGLAFWSGLIDRGISRADVVLGIESCLETRTRTVASL